MTYLDVSKDWVILAELSAMEAAAELSGYFGLLREKADLRQEQPQISELGTALPEPSAPKIILKAGGEIPDNSGFTWRLGKNLLEISGDSLRGLWNGVFNFLAALGFKWPVPGQEEPPAVREGAVFSLNNNNAYCSPAPSAQERRRIFVPEKAGAMEREELIKWAARNRYDALVFSLKERSLWARARAGKRILGKDDLVKRYAFMLEAGGCDMSLLLPRRLFFLNRDLFRMESGTRSSKNHFCPTNPKTISRITKMCRQLFTFAAPGMTTPRVFHLLPDRGHEKTWCACPACRAFSPSEQNLIAVNSAADVLAILDPQAFISGFDFSATGDESDTGGIKSRKNAFLLKNAGILTLN